MRYQAVCEDCVICSYLYNDRCFPKHFAEVHMMRTGHTVQIKEIKTISDM